MLGSMDITTTSDNAESPDTAGAGPIKPSLRTLDQAFTNLTTREQDLAHGPLLLGLGDGQEHIQDPQLSHLGLELASRESARYSANGSILPLLSSGVPLLLSARAMTQSTISQSGASLSLPSGSIAHETVYHPEKEAALPENQNSAALPLAWNYELSWEDSRLCFDTTPLEIVEVLEDQSSEANPASEPRCSASQASFSRLPAPLSGAGEFDPFSTTGIGGFCGSAEVRPTLSLPEDIEVASINSSAFSDCSEVDNTMVDDHIEESSDPGVAIAMEKSAEWLAKLLFDDFFRSYARQKSGNQTAAAKDQNLASEPGNKAQRFGGNRGHVKKSRKSRAAGRSEGSGDEDSGDDGQRPSRAAKSSDSQYLACPFLKWDPIRFAQTCNRRFKQIRDVKYHLESKHKEDYCPNREMVFNETNISTHVCDPKHVRPLALMTEAKFAAIKAIRGSEAQWKKKLQWHEIYKIIFPNDPPCLSPYFNKEADRRLGGAHKYLRHPDVRALIHETAESRAFEFRVRASFLERLFYDILSTAWERYDINDEGEPYMTHDKEPAARHAQPSKTVNFGTHDTIISHDTSSNTSQRPHGGMAMPQSCTVTGSTNYSASMLDIYAAQEQSENITSDFFPDLTDSGEFSDPARRGLMGICESGSWEISTPNPHIHFYPLSWLLPMTPRVEVEPCDLQG